MMSDGPAYNKYRSRQDIEREYYREWERTTLVAKEELDQPMTIMTFLTFLPTWFKFYGLPGPVRFIIYLLWQRAAAFGHKLHKKLVLQGVKLDRELVRKAKLPEGVLSRRLVMFRYHYRISAFENIKYRLALLQGKVYRPKVKPVHDEDRRSMALERLDPNEYDPTSDPWPTA
ncbi:hypothetical protein NADE_006293 [Nannochloris sp. 'desiccata']|nr:hypothetical protein KSW81_008189 [Chlorella desiccata (nom. nud.)]KAH7619452.1 hypothetical protein NADE_006293 [Chlorella desiccata (nom. nud.)]